MNIEKFKKRPVLGILRGIKEAEVSPLFDTLIDAGLETVEIALNTENAYSIIETIATNYKKEITIGAGTVLNIQDLEKALSAGASFIVSPVLKEDICLYCSNNNIPYFPGALTPTEIHTAWDKGASMVKVFPASSFGPKYLQSIKGPFESISLMAVGGVTMNNVSEYFQCGADAVAIGASILKRNLIEENKFDIIKDNVSKIIQTTLKNVN